MHGLRTNGSREVSPLFASHESSPAAVFKQSPSPGDTAFSNGVNVAGLGPNSWSHTNFCDVKQRFGTIEMVSPATVSIHSLYLAHDGGSGE